MDMDMIHLAGIAHLAPHLLWGTRISFPTRNIPDFRPLPPEMDTPPDVIQQDAQKGIGGLFAVDRATFRFYIFDLLSFNGSYCVNY